mmetsp:Transcript_70545/g.187950  ORF Transcript_70545/g.187950 Transcript_70545/m.187950 type:complete len:241 (-) Transcript_70545:443-1165(-)
MTTRKCRQNLGCPQLRCVIRTTTMRKIPHTARKTRGEEEWAPNEAPPQSSWDLATCVSLGLCDGLSSKHTPRPQPQRRALRCTLLRRTLRLGQVVVRRGTPESGGYQRVLLAYQLCQSLDFSLQPALARFDGLHGLQQGGLQGAQPTHDPTCSFRPPCQHVATSDTHRGTLVRLPLCLRCSGGGSQIADPARCEAVKMLGSTAARVGRLWHPKLDPHAVLSRHGVGIVAKLRHVTSTVWR